MSAPQPHAGQTDLSVLQGWFQAVITNAQGVEAGISSELAQRLLSLKSAELEKVITRSRALTAAERVAIYANAYHNRLFECLGEVFPMLKRTLGEDAFNGLALGYLQDYPSRSYTLNELGRHFPSYLERTRPAADSAESRATAGPDCEGEPMENWPDFLIDLARLEWVIYEVFDGPGVEGAPLLSGSDLAAISPDLWPDVRLVPVVCLKLLKTRFPVNEYFTSLRRAKPDEAVEIPAARESFVAVTRREWIVRRHSLCQMQFALLEALQQGRTVGESVERAVALGEGDMDQMAADLQAWFRTWTLNGFFQAVVRPA